MVQTWQTDKYRYVSNKRCFEQSKLLLNWPRYGIFGKWRPSNVIDYLRVKTWQESKYSSFQWWLFLCFQKIILSLCLCRLIKSSSGRWWETRKENKLPDNINFAICKCLELRCFWRCHSGVQNQSNNFEQTYLNYVWGSTNSSFQRSFIKYFKGHSSNYMENK